MTLQLGIIFGLMIVIQVIQTGAHAARLAGVRTGQPMLANSLYNVMALGSRGASAIAMPLLASLTDVAVRQQNTETLLNVYRLVLLATALGALAAALLIPTMSRVLARSVASYQKRRSLPNVVVHGITVHGLAWIKSDLQQPRVGVRTLWRAPIPRKLIAAGVIATALELSSQFAAMYASALAPEGARTAASLSPLISGPGLFLATLIIGPLTSLIIDEALQGKRPLEDVTYLSIWQIGAQLVGILMAQALLWPLGQLIAIVTRWLIA